MGQSNFTPKHRAVGKAFNGRKKIDSMYDGAWEKYRERFLRINPYCYACGEYANVVDHLMPHQGDERLFKKLDNHIPLCTRCHNTATTLFDRKYRSGNSITPKIQWLSRNRVVGEDRFRKVRVLASYE